jgi:hypothetical protein
MTGIPDNGQKGSYFPLGDQPGVMLTFEDN